ncbi:MAG: carbamoyltransferase HypF [Spirochaetes bacterium]|nr:carbamoyltransferase HypF [Spirochaetota bacterium]
MTTHYHIQVKGIVQGVGFRPFVYNIAVSHNLCGSVSNNTEGVTIHLEGPESEIQKCIEIIRTNPPPLAQIIDIHIEKLPPDGFTHFSILESTTTTTRDVFIPPDVAICPECLSDFFDMGNRRYHYPFTTCTHCGPRFSIIQDIPYDRENTAMNPFIMCSECQREYTNPRDRRFHTQPNACATCGPHIVLCDSSGNILQTQFDDIIIHLQKILRTHIVALKSVGGYHLACDATNDECVKLLRQRKQRPFKPFAIMVSSLEFLETFCTVTNKEKELLQSKERPIVLVQLQKNIISPYVAPGLSYIGVMLPYTPFQYMLFHNNTQSIYVMTSANISDEPIIYKDDDAFERLHSIADYFVTYNREILSHTDDSVMYVVDEKPYFVRRSRGFVPAPLFIKQTPVHILATGGDLKNSFALARNNVTVVSQYLGDLSTPWGNELYKKTIAHYCKIFDFEPQSIVHDLHPNYFTTMYAHEYKERGMLTVGVQHHHAHIASVCEEHKLYEPVIGIAFDGTGYGTDHTLWGSEFLIADTTSFTRAAHFDYFGLPGGENAIKDPWKIGLSLLMSGTIDDKNFFTEKKEKDFVKEIIYKNINCPLTCSIGRLFDGVAAILGIAHHISTEAQAAMLLEEYALHALNDTTTFTVPIKEDASLVIDTSYIIREIITMYEANIPVTAIAMRFHRAIADVTIATALKLKDLYNINKIVLSGGVFHNRILLHLISTGLQKKSFDVYIPQKLPCNDGGIALGQIAIGRDTYGH